MIRSEPGKCSGISTHDLTKRSTEAAGGQAGRSGISTHDLTKRSTFPEPYNSDHLPYFNSRPHEEVDARNQVRPVQAKISTHDLTKRSTTCNL